MSVEKEIRDYLASETKDLSTKGRDIDLILYYYGFGSSDWPTLEDAAIEFDVGDSKGRRSERPRQIIKKKFRSNASISFFPSLIGFKEMLYSSKMHSSEKLWNKCVERGFLDDQGNLPSLLKLLHEIGEAKEYEAYSLELADLTRSSYAKNKDIIVAEKGSVRSLRQAVSKSKTVPGLIGVAKIDYLFDAVGRKSVDIDFLISILKKDPDSWFCSYDGEGYFIFQSRDNTLINSLEKIRNVAESEQVDVLTDTLSNSLRRRTPPKGRKYPPDDVIKKYLLSSKYTEVVGDIVSLKVEPEALTNIEASVVDLLKENDIDDYPAISSSLISQGYSKPAVDKAVFHSPLIHVDKSEGRYHYKYRLVGSKFLGFDRRPDIYEQFRQRLLKAASEGTDGSSKVISRKEHYILSEWLFKNKEYERCAICGKTYSIRSLVTAHKKRRADCAENERTDPNIVMPLCNFGCDYMYENGFIYVDNGIVYAVKSNETKCFDEKSAIQAVVGKVLDSKWRKGEESFFKKPGNEKKTAP